MTDVWFVVAGYTVILGGLAAYAALLLVRLRDARRTAEGMRGPGPGRNSNRDDRSGEPPADLPA